MKGNRDHRGRHRGQPPYSGGQKPGDTRPANAELVAPLPANVRALAVQSEHPGLWLDRYAATWKPAWISGLGKDSLSADVQKPTLNKVAALTKNAPASARSVFAAAAAQHEDMLVATGARRFTATTAGPLTLHLARAAALENAGLSLHPLYGFACLPASGLKGMARAYAEAVWLPSLDQTEQALGWKRIEDVFGWAPTRERHEQIRSDEHPAQEREANGQQIAASAGQVAFHDAWPTDWPELMVDVVNNHHPGYYASKPEHVPPPGDWENPVPVYFLAVEPGTRFRFALAPLRPGAAPALLAQAEEWLLGALTHEGAGAKTAAGYGRFRADAPEVQERTPALPAATRAVFETELELVTPAFLAGAGRTREDCDLRPATLRGVLRWWWRTLHAGFLEPAALRALETAIWGSAEVGGAVRIGVEAVFGQNAQQPKPGDFRPNTGLGYIGYGVQRRWYQPDGARWRVRLGARESRFTPSGATNAQRLPAEAVLGQAQVALWLLCHFGGAGSKARKGFGSFAVPAAMEAWKLEGAFEMAARFREAAAVGGAASLSQSASFEWMMDDEIELQARDAWHALEKVGLAYQRAIKAIEPKRNRRALGLPRNQKLPPEEVARFVTGKHVADRHASPLHLHVEPKGRGWMVRATVFPSLELPADPTGEASEALLEQVLESFRQSLE